MRKRLLTLALGCTLLAGGTAAFTAVLGQSFDHAPSGVAIPFTHHPLPRITEPLMERGAAWSPSTQEFLNGNTVITNHEQATDVYRRLFRQPWDRSVDFNQDYMILMGGGLMDLPSFAISAVEEVDADHATRSVAEVNVGLYLARADWLREALTGLEPSAGGEQCCVGCG